jgi:hypothetical protein
MRFPQDRPPVRQEIQNARGDGSFEHVLGERDSGTLAADRSNSSSGCLAFQLIEHRQGRVKRNDITLKIREGIRHRPVPAPTSRTRAPSVSRASNANRRATSGGSAAPCRRS